MQKKSWIVEHPASSFGSCSVCKNRDRTEHAPSCPNRHRTVVVEMVQRMVIPVQDLASVETIEDLKPDEESVAAAMYDDEATTQIRFVREATAQDEQQLPFYGGEIDRRLYAIGRKEKD